MSHAVSCEEWMRRAAAAERERDELRARIEGAAVGWAAVAEDGTWSGDDVFADEPAVRSVVARDGGTIKRVRLVVEDGP